MKPTMEPLKHAWLHLTVLPTHAGRAALGRTGMPLWTLQTQQAREPQGTPKLGAGPGWPGISRAAAPLPEP